MASIGHVAVGLASGRASARRALGPMVLLAVLSMLPDLDVIGFRYHVPYASPFGHRGATHSILAGVVIGVVAGLLFRIGSLSRAARVLVCVAVVCSHGLLDTMTDGGLGVALAWPISYTRYFAPVRPIPVAPIGARMLSRRGARVLAIEGLMCSPLLLYALWPRRRASW